MYIYIYIHLILLFFPLYFYIYYLFTFILYTNFCHSPQLWLKSHRFLSHAVLKKSTPHTHTHFCGACAIKAAIQFRLFPRASHFFYLRPGKKQWGEKNCAKNRTIMQAQQKTIVTKCETVVRKIGKATAVRTRSHLQYVHCMMLRETTSTNSTTLSRMRRPWGGKTHSDCQCCWILRFSRIYFLSLNLDSFSTFSSQNMVICNAHILWNMMLTLL